MHIFKGLTMRTHRCLVSTRRQTNMARRSIAQNTRGIHRVSWLKARAGTALGISEVALLEIFEAFCF